MAKTATAQEIVRNQYEQLPYPARNPQEELKGIHSTCLDRLDYLQTHYSSGAINFDDYRILIAGDGTGDASIFMAEQLADTNAEIIALDLSSTSQAIAKERAEKRGLTNIKHVQGSLLNLPKLKLGNFDYITCNGVLHHLEDPSKGLKALKKALRPNGVMGIMVYGKIGRTGVYQAQQFLRLVTAGLDDIEAKVDMAIRYVQSLPKSNWLAHNISHYQSGLNLNDRAGIYDLLLHSHDVSYSVSELYDWVEDAGLYINELMEPGRGAAFSYNPLLQVNDPVLRAQLARLPLRDAQQACEIMTGTLSRHFFYASAKPQKPAFPSLADETLIPHYISGAPLADDLDTLCHQLDVTAIGKKLGLSDVNTGRPYCIMTRQDFTPHLIKLIDGELSMSELISKAISVLRFDDNDTTRQKLRSDLLQLLHEGIGAGIIGLRKPEGKHILHPKALQARMLKRIGA